MVGAKNRWAVHAGYWMVIVVLGVMLVQKDGEEKLPVVDGGGEAGRSGLVKRAKYTGAGGYRDTGAGGYRDTGAGRDTRMAADTGRAGEGGRTEERVVVPRRFMESLKMPRLLARSGTGVNPAVGELLGLDEFKVAKVDEVLLEALGAMQVLEKRYAELVSEPGGDEYYRVGAFGEEGAEVRKVLKENLVEVLGEGLAGVFDVGLEREFGGFGREAREIFVVWPEDGGSDRVFVQTRASRVYARRQPESSGMSLTVEEAMARYGHLLKTSDEKFTE